MTGLKHAYHGRSHRRFGSDPIGTENQRMPFVHLNGSLTGETIPTGSYYYPTLSGLEVVPLNAGGTIDAEVFGAIDAGDAEIDVETGGSSNEPFKYLHIRQPGLYWFEFLLDWYLDWDGPIRANYEIIHSDGDESVITPRIYLHAAEGSYFGGWADSEAPHFALTARTHIMVDERAEDVHVRGAVRNESGSNQTYSGGHSVGGFQLTVIQMSTSGYSNPPQ